MDLHTAWKAFASSPSEATFQPLYEGTRRLVWTLCVRITGDETEAQDAFQGTYARLLEIARQGGGSSPQDEPARLVSRLAIREADRLRQRSRRERARRRPLAEDLPMSHSAPPGDELSRREAREKVESLVSLLPEKQRLAVQLHFFHGLTQREVAAALDLSVSTVAERIQNALRRLDGPLASAGLGRASGVMATVALTASLLEPRMAAAAVFRGAQALATTFSASSVVVSTATGSTALLGGFALMKTKAALIVSLIAALFAGALFIFKEAAPDRGPRPLDAGPAVAVAPQDDAAPATVAARPQLAPEPEAPPPAELHRNEITGKITDAVTGEGIPGAAVRSRELEAIADNDGRYTLTGPGQGELALVASAPGYAAGAARVSRAGEQVSAQDFQLDPAFSVKIVVVDGEARPLAQARVTPPRPGAENTYDDSTTVLTDAAGVAMLEDVSRLRTPEIMVSKEGYSQSYARPKPDDSPIVEHKVVLQPLAPSARLISGRVTDERERPIAGAVIEWKDGEGTAFGAGAVYGQFRATSGLDGTYRLEFDDDHPTCELGVSAPGWSPVVAAGVRSGSAEAPGERDFVLAPAGWLGGRVIDEAGRPLAGVKIRSMPRRDLLNAAVAYPSVLRQTTSDGEGRFRLEDVAAPAAGVSFRAPDGRPQLEIELDANREHEVVLAGFAAIHGTVTDAETGSPVPAFNIKISGVGLVAERANLGDTFTSSEGRFRLEGIEPAAAIELFIEAEGFVTARVTGIEPLRLPAEGLKVELERGRLLEGVVVDALTGAAIPEALVLVGPEDGLRTVQDAEWKWRSQVLRYLDIQRRVTAADGSFGVRESSPGAIFVRAPGRERLLVEASSRKRHTDRAGRLRLPLAAGIRLDGVVLEGGAPARGARVTIERAGAPWDDKPAEARIHGEATTDGDGRFGWDDLSAGEHVAGIVRKLPLGAKEIEIELRKRIELAPGVVHTVELGNGLGPHQIHGRIAGMEATDSLAVTITLRPLESRDGEEIRFRTYRQREWRYKCAFLRPGRHAVEATYWHQGGTRTEQLAPLEIAGDGERDITIAPK